MAVKPEVQVVLDLITAADPPPIDQQTPEQLRHVYGALANISAAKEPVGSVTDRTIPGPSGDIPVRVYVPARDDVSGAETSEDGERRPVLVFFHGGGWVIGDLDTHDPTVRALANGSGATIVSVDYRLAPEHPYPAAVGDCLAAVRWVAGNADELGLDPTRLAVGGDSAGGNLAALAAQQLRDTGPEIRFQLLVYPALDLTFSHRSIDENAEGYFLTKEAMLWFRGHYIGDRDPADPAISPLHATDDALAGLPAALLITAEYDPLRDEGEAYAARLRAAGVPATASRYDGVIHGFLSMGDVIPDGKAAMDEAAQALRAALA